MTSPGIRSSSLLKRLPLGHLKYKLYYAPRNFLKTLAKVGIRSYVRTEVGLAQMRASTKELPPLPCSSSAELAVHFLTGDKYWYQALYCAYSLAQASGRNVQPFLYDDGSLQQDQITEFKRVFANVSVIDRETIQHNLEELLPKDKFPTLRAHREVYFHLRKLTDIHTMDPRSSKLVLDSDMLFFERPEELIQWCDNPNGFMHMIDIEYSYGYAVGLLEELADREIPQLINVGVCGITSSNIDWNALEHWCRELLERAGSTYYLEQALVALLASSQKQIALPAADYIVMPSNKDVTAGRGALHHYVADSKEAYFHLAWKKILEKSRS